MSHDRYNKNFTAFKVTVDSTGNTSRKELKDAVTTWCENNLALVGAGYAIRSNTADGMFRVMVNELKVRNSGYTQLLWLKRDRKGPTDIRIDLSGEVL
mgnify:CR=1 FL=1